MTTRLMRPRTPYFIAVPAAARDEPQWAILHDFALIFPRHREDELRQRGVHFAGYPQLHSRRMTLESEGVLRAARLGKGEVGLLHVRGFLQRVEPELKNLLEHFRSSYVPENLTGLEYF